MVQVIIIKNPLSYTDFPLGIRAVKLEVFVVSRAEIDFGVGCVVDIAVCLKSLIPSPNTGLKNGVSTPPKSRKPLNPTVKSAPVGIKSAPHKKWVLNLLKLKNVLMFVDV
jgi:hypothetical protein